MNETLVYLSERFPHDTLPIELPSLWEAVELENAGLARETFDGAWTITAAGLIAVGDVDDGRDTIPSPPPVPREENAGRRLVREMKTDESALLYIPDEVCLAAIPHITDWHSVRVAVSYYFHNADRAEGDNTAFMCDAGAHLLDVACDIALGERVEK